MREGDLLWEPRGPSKLSAYIEERGFSDYHELWRWSVEDLEGFWGSIWERYERRPAARARARRRPHAGRRVVPGNAAELRRAALPAGAPGRDGDPARERVEPAGRDVLGRAARADRALRRGLRRLGVERGDRVAAYMPNVPETVVAFLACASIGAVWSSCAPEFGVAHGRRPLQADRAARADRDRGLPLRRQGLRPPRPRARDRGGDPVARAHRARPVRLGRAALGARRARVRAAALRPPAVGALLVGHHRAAQGDRAGPGRHPARAPEEGEPALGPVRARPLLLVHDDRLDDVELPRRRAARRGGDRALRRPARSRRPVGARAPSAGVTSFGTSAGFIARLHEGRLEPARPPGLRAIGSTGSPLPVEGFEWVYRHFPDVWLFSTSGGTDLCTAFVGGVPVAAGLRGRAPGPLPRGVGRGVERGRRAARRSRSASS